MYIPVTNEFAEYRDDDECKYDLHSKRTKAGAQ